jgi:hypothetical protein
MSKPLKWLPGLSFVQISDLGHNCYRLPVRFWPTNSLADLASKNIMALYSERNPFVLHLQTLIKCHIFIIPDLKARIPELNSSNNSSIYFTLSVFINTNF